MTTSSRMHGEFLRLLFLQAHRETTAHFLATGLPSQQNRSDNEFRFKRAAFYMGLKSKVGEREREREREREAHSDKGTLTAYKREWTSEGRDVREAAAPASFLVGSGAVFPPPLLLFALGGARGRRLPPPCSWLIMQTGCARTCCSFFSEEEVRAPSTRCWSPHSPLV